MKRNLRAALFVAIVVLFGASFAHADSVTDTDVKFTAFVTGTTVTLDIQCMNVSVCGNWYLGDVTLKGFTFSGSPALGVAPSGYTIENGGQDNNGVGNGGGCNGTQMGGAVCWDAPTALSTQLGGGVHVFTANITGGVPGTLHVQATGYTNTSGDQTHGGKVLAVSDDLARTPDPGFFVLFASGMLVLAILRRRAFSIAQA